MLDDGTVLMIQVNIHQWFMYICFVFLLSGIKASATASHIEVLKWWRWDVSFTGGGNRSTRRKPPWIHRAFGDYPLTLSLWRLATSDVSFSICFWLRMASCFSWLARSRIFTIASFILSFCCSSCLTWSCGKPAQSSNQHKQIQYESVHFSWVKGPKCWPHGTV